MIVEVDPASPTPPYEQLRAQVERLAASGVLQPGVRLPTIRQLAGDLGLAPGTVARAYRELEAAGLIVSKGRRGTCIADQPVGAIVMTAAERSRRLTEAANVFATAARQLGVDPRAAMKQVSAALDVR